ncbi:MAG: ComF family protein [Bryobacter sp.]|nr:ComF family protein [Bryobacter sp.]
MRQFIHEFKYHDMPGLDSLLVKFLAQGLPPGLEFDLVVPVPMHWWKHYLRTYNPASRLARKLARRLGLAYASPLRKVKNTAPQAQLNGRQRRRNLKDAFAVRRPARVAGKKILLVDDVFTTGTTVNACARALKQAGAQYVAVLALARTDRRSRSGPEAALAVSQFA